MKTQIVTNEILKLEFLRHILVNQERFCFLFGRSLNENEFLDLINNLYKISPPPIYKYTKNCPNEIYYYYSINKQMSSNNIFEGINLSNYYICELKKSSNFLSTELFSAITNPSFTFSTAKFSFNLHRLIKKDPPLFRALRSRFLQILHNKSKFSTAELVKYFGVSLFEMDEQIDSNLLNSFDLLKNVTNANISSFLQIPAVLTTEKTVRLIQSLLCCNEPFPSYSKIFNENNLLTLLNNSILKRSHFTEFLLKCGQSFSCHFSKMKAMLEECNCSEFLPFYFLLIGEELTELPLDQLKKVDDSKVLFIFKRIYGDQQLSNFMRTMLGSIVPLERLINNSLNIILKPVLMQIDADSMIFLSSLKFYSINDNDRDQDFNFYFGFRLICDIIKGNIKGISKLLRKINDKRILIDAFSVLFVKNKEGNRFVCSLDVAEEVISHISTLLQDEIDIFASAAKRIVLGRYINSNNSKSIKSCFLSSKDIVIRLLSRKEYRKAIDASINNDLPDLKKLIEIAKAITSVNRFSHSPILDKELQKSFNIEYSLSTNEVDQYIFDNCDISNDIKSILNKREGKILKSILSPINQVSDLASSAQIYIDRISQIPITLKDKNKIKKNDVFEKESLKDSNDNHLLTFINLAEKFKDSIKKISAVEDLVDIVVENSSNYKTFSEAFECENCLDNALRFSDNLKNKDKFIQIVNEKSEITAIALQIQSLAEKLYPKANQILHRLLNQEKQLKLEKSKERHRTMEVELDEIFKDQNNRKEMVNNLIDFRLMHSDEEIQTIRKKLEENISFNEFLEIFPEFRTSQLEAINSKFATSDFVLDVLIESNNVTSALHFTKVFDVEELLISKLVNKVRHLKAKNDNRSTTLLFTDWRIISSKIFDRLPKEYQNLNSQIDILKRGLPINEKHPELPVLCQYPYLNFDEDLLKIFDEKTKCINNLPNLSNSSSLTQISSNSGCSVNASNDIKNEISKYSSSNQKTSQECVSAIFSAVEEYSNYYLKYFKNYHLIIEKIGKVLFKVVDSIYVNSVESEVIANKTLEKVNHLFKSTKLSLLNFFKDSFFPFEFQIPLIECLIEFNEVYFYNRFRIEYSFKGFNSDKNHFPRFFINLCYQYDHVDLFRKFADLWNVDISTTYFKRIETAYQLGQYTAVLNLINSFDSSCLNNQSLLNSKPFTSKNSASIPIELKESLKNVFEKPIFFNITETVDSNDPNIKNNYSKFLSLFSNPSSNPKLDKAASISTKNSLLVNNSSYNEILSTYIEKFYQPIEKIGILSSLGDFNEAFKIYFHVIPRQQRNAGIVLVEIFFSALNSFNYEKLYTFLNSVKDSKEYQILFKEIVPSLRRMKLKTTLIDFLNKFEKYEIIIQHLMEILLNEEENWNEIDVDIKILIETIQKELSRRTQKANSSKTSKTETYTFTEDELKRILTQSGIQCTFTTLCIEKNICFSKKLSLLNNKKCGEDMAVLALFHEKFNLALQIIEQTSQFTNNNLNRNKNINVNATDDINRDVLIQASLFKICDRLVDMLNENHMVLSKFFKDMTMKLDHKTYELFAMVLSKVVFGRAVSAKDVPIFIESNVEGRHLQSKILIELGLLNAAFNVATKTSDLKLIKTIEFQARVTGNKSLQTKCIKYLESLKV
ncbi:hypothetical protein TRFO_16315 [Tritrichomonas foetus]|uniref:Uncharacterized protein n=1 Tax=Tritrichomonas foetus TaxID=1144522 RepID=A0A1J4KR97_9EUKA|nr:hypothetical protein TRFO_16315 [Tritrichomonas foetus]|eukprot:OHT13456.1 hypothetical protein TRFO_16315 [Tritrichomonas foetus]